MNLLLFYYTLKFIHSKILPAAKCRSSYQMNRSSGFSFVSFIMNLYELEMDNQSRVLIWIRIEQMMEQLLFSSLPVPYSLIWSITFVKILE